MKLGVKSASVMPSRCLAMAGGVQGGPKTVRTVGSKG